MPDLPALLDALRENPNDEARWLAYAQWLADNGWGDEAVAVRVYWRVFRKNVVEFGVPVDETVRRVAQAAPALGWMARQVEERGYDPTGSRSGP